MYGCLPHEIMQAKKTKRYKKITPPPPLECASSAQDGASCAPHRRHDAQQRFYIFLAGATLAVFALTTLFRA